ncbi:MAG TPA: SPOR domain-containing protein [Chiayiivirga sp.]|nr:SPOR domain-containing protein [Chiayiivirga sp.]
MDAGRFWLQVASFGEAANAQRLVDRLTHAEVVPVSVQPAQVSGRTVYRVRVGPLPSRHRSLAVSDTLHAMGLGVPTLITQ